MKTYLSVILILIVTSYCDAAKVLYFSNSAGFEHTAVKVVDGKPSVSDVAITNVCKPAGIEVVCTKDGSVFDGDLSGYDAFVFQTSGELSQGSKQHPEWALTEKGWQNLRNAVRAGKGFVGLHPATDSNRSGGSPYEPTVPEKITGYTKFIGAEFTIHGKPQDAVVTIVEPSSLPFLTAKGKSFKTFEEWYCHKNFADDIHIFALLETAGMEGVMYDRPRFPIVWGRTEDKGRVFYSAFGHFDNYWQNAENMQLVLQLIKAATGELKTDLTPNIKTVTPGANVLRQPIPPYVPTNNVQNTNNTMTAGSFGVAWIGGDGTLQAFDGKTIVSGLPSTKVFAVSADDLLGEGSDQLLYLDDDIKGLNIYSFKTKKLLGPLGSNVKTFTTGVFSTEESFPSVFVCTFASDTFRWTRDIMNKGWIGLTGEFSQAASGKLKPQNQIDDFVVVTSGNVYSFSPKWLSYSKVVEGKNIVAALMGNVTASAGDEVILLDKDGNVLLAQNGGVEDLQQKAKCVTFGKNGNGLATLYVLNLQGKPAAYDRETKTWREIATTQSNAASIITRTNTDGNGHSLFVLAGDKLCQVLPNELVVEPPKTSVWLNIGDNGNVAEYKYERVVKPYVKTLCTPSGRNILRDSPYDHVHHHGLMFAIAVNGNNFWEENGNKFGKEITTSINKQANLLTTNLDWNTFDGKTILKEVREISVTNGEKVTLLNWQSKLSPPSPEQTANLDKSSHYYYGLGMRFDKSMDKDGRFFSDADQQVEAIRRDERLTKCRWMAYTSKLNGELVTVAIFGHPTNSIPTLAFTMGDAGKSFAYLGISLNLHREPVTIEKNESRTFRFQVAVWDGEATKDVIEKTFKEYAATK
ncbi:MAG: PmoA family protein [Planctomycetaceae bacterium]|jgi:type 1 glutamine amidotransferase|nr:PmoA family protein [Planctomycetaceae bacterium]